MLAVCAVTLFFLLASHFPAAAQGAEQNGLSLSLGIDAARNAAFVRKEDSGFASFVYKMVKRDGRMMLELSSNEIVGAWKGKKVLSDIPFNSAGYFETDEQFAPVFLLADLRNDGLEAVSVDSAYLEVKSSETDLQPLVQIGDWGRLQCSDGAYNPEFDLRNYGWGAVSKPELVHTFKAGRSASREYTASQPDFDIAAKGSVDASIVAAGADAKRLKQGHFKCASVSRVPACLKRLKASGALGDLAGYTYTEENKVLTDAVGELRYQWKDIHGVTQSRVSPFRLPISLLYFDVGGGPECGAPAPVDRNEKPLKLALDKASYRIPLQWRGPVESRAEKRFAFSLAADKASHHVFALVLKLSNGSTLRTPPADLSYFKPRFPPPERDPQQ